MYFEQTYPQPFNLKAVIKTHGWFQLVPFYWEEETASLRWAIRLENSSPILIVLKEEIPTKEFARIVFETTEILAQDQQDIILQKFQHIFNINVDLADFYKICSQNDILKKVEPRGMGRLMRSESVYEDVFKSICGTNIQWKQAVKVINTISQIGDVVPGTDFHVFPTPKQILQKGENWLKDVGRVGYRSGYLVDLCERFENDPYLGQSAENGTIVSKDLLKYFVDFKGIGKVTARYLAALYGYFGEMAIDSLVISFMSQTHFNGETPTNKQIEEFYAKFGEWKYLAYWMEFMISEGWNPDAK
jgi:3-methyladenine DNA glycosylase/8-oxoguanine DNA glycosylase